MRKAEGKTTGYVFLPLFVQEAGGESIEEAIERTDFEEVWNVLQALQEQDEVFADTIREMRETHGRAAGFDDSRFRERVQIVGPAVSLDMLRQSITTRCVERLAASWDYVFGKLSAFKDRFTHCNVPQNWPEDPSLGFWVGFQRQLKKRGALSRNRMGRLDEIGFRWTRERPMGRDVHRPRSIQGTFQALRGSRRVGKRPTPQPVGTASAAVEEARQARERAHTSASISWASSGVPTLLRGRRCSPGWFSSGNASATAISLRTGRRIRG